MFPLYENLTYSRSDLPIILYKLEPSDDSGNLIRLTNFTSIENRESFTSPCLDYTHWHSSYEILLITANGTELYLNGETLYPKTGDIILIDSFDIHTVGIKHHHYVLLIDPSRLHVPFELFPISNENKLIRRDGPNESLRKELELRIYNLSERLVDPANPNTLGVLGEIYMLLDNISSYTNLIEPDRHKEHKSRQSSQKDTLKKIFHFIEQNYREEISLSDIASVAGFNESYFCRFFKGATGRTLVEYLNEYRCHIARRRIENSSDSITEIALDSGFSSVSYFSRIFKTKFGVSPRTYKKSLIQP